MRTSVTPAELESLGLSPEAARRLAVRTRASLRGRELRDPDEQTQAWLALQDILLSDAAWRWYCGVHSLLFRLVYSGRRPEDGPAPAWVSTEQDLRGSNLASLMSEVGATTYEDLHRWSASHRAAFWSVILRRLRIVFRRTPDAILAAKFDATAPDWLPGARLNIAESCLSADPTKTAILSASETAPAIRPTSYGELRRLCGRVANGLEDLGVAPGERVALYMPMTAESVAIFLGVILAGRAVVGIADTSAPPEFAKRARIGGAKAVFTVDSYRRDGKDLPIYEKVVAAKGPPAVVLPVEGDAAKLERNDDRQWGDFLSARDALEPVACAPSDATNILFSSGTTKDPKAIVWSHVTPIKSAADAYLHHDVHESDILAWPTSFGWMMGPWLTYASLVNRATMALYVGSPAGAQFGRFVQDAGVTMLGVVPKLVRTWRETRAVEASDWSRIRVFSSTAEPSTPEDMFYLMFLAGYKPIVEYCGGTEVGGGYLAGTVVQPCAPGTFTTPALGLDLVILEEGKAANRGEVFLVPPSIGLSNDLLNYDNLAEYYEGVPRGPDGEVLRRHGDRIERLPGGFYRHLGRVDDMINIHGVKTSSEEIRGVLAHEAVSDAKPIAVDVEGTGQASLVVYAVPKDLAAIGSEALRARLRADFQAAIKAKLNPLLAHVRDVILVRELPQAGPGKTRTMQELQRDYLRRREQRA